MKPYSSRRHTKGLAGRRRSTDTPHRRRCLRVDKRAARREAEKEARRQKEEDLDMRRRFYIEHYIKESVRLNDVMNGDFGQLI